VKFTASVAEPGYPFLAVAVIVALFAVPGGSGPKVVELADKTTSAIVALAELVKDATWIISASGGPPPATETQLPTELVWGQPDWNFTGIPPALVVPVIL
jgi:hypothetical protein